MYDSEWKNITHFSALEFDYPTRMDYDFITRLDAARSRAGIPFEITSDYRDNDIHSPHASGRAVDIRAHHSWVKFKIVKALLETGFLRIGIYDKHIHVDRDPNGPENVLWIGESK